MLACHANQRSTLLLEMVAAACGRYSVEWRRSSGAELLPVALRGGIRSRRKSSDTRPASFLGALQGEDLIHMSRWPTLP